ncbi:MAG: hypothetical protein PHU96_03955 [Candidatus Omnitrophica bacterium]|nr:hypothetical protein [Candidatus Omnitrophota bacterium]
MSEADNYRVHPGFAAILSFLFVGLGQLYNGQINKGLLLIFSSAVSLIVLIFGSVLMAIFLWGKITSFKVFIFGSGIFLIGLIAICLLAIYSINDAYLVAAKK